MRELRLLAGLLAASAFAADAGLDGILKSVETRYNKAKTLQVLFKEDYTPPGRARRTESGILMLRKPGRVKVTGFTHSFLSFPFDQEGLDPPLENKHSQFQPPKGAEVVEGEQ